MKFVMKYQYFEMVSLVMTKDSKDTDMNELIAAMVGRSSG